MTSGAHTAEPSLNATAQEGMRSEAGMGLQGRLLRRQMLPPSSREKVSNCSAEESPRPPHTGTPKADHCAEGSPKIPHIDTPKVDHSAAPDRATLLSSGLPGLRDTPGTPLFMDSLECSCRRDLARDP